MTAADSFIGSLLADNTAATELEKYAMIHLAINTEGSLSRELTKQKLARIAAWSVGVGSRAVDSVQCTK